MGQPDRVWFLRVSILKQSIIFALELALHSRCNSCLIGGHLQEVAQVQRFSLISLFSQRRCLLNKLYFFSFAPSSYFPPAFIAIMFTLSFTENYQMMTIHPGGVLQMSSDRDDARIFLCLNFQFPDFLGRKLWQVFFLGGLI